MTGTFGVLEVINSGSCFELPRETLEDIRAVLRTKNIARLIFESPLDLSEPSAGDAGFLWNTGYRQNGCGNLDYDFRERVLNKHADFRKPQRAAAFFDSICLMVGIKGQDERDDPQ